MPYQYHVDRFAAVGAKALYPLSVRRWDRESLGHTL